MSTVMAMKWDGVTPEQYEKVRKSVNWEGDTPKGAIFHVAGFSNNELRVTDLWDSESDFNSFVENRLMPGVAVAGIQGQPQVEMFPAHAIFVAASERLK